MGLFKKKIVKKTYDREHMKPVIRASICTGEEVEKEYQTSSGSWMNARYSSVSLQGKRSYFIKVMKITYINHSGFLIETKDCYYIFDYYKGELPLLDKKKEVIVFCSHFHEDHFNPVIFEILDDMSMTYQAILAKDIRKRKHLSDMKITYVYHDQTYNLDNGTQVDTLLSNDSGVAFIVKTKEGTIYHAGDLNDWYWDGEPKADNQRLTSAYRAEIRKIKGMHFDAAFVPLDPRQGNHYADGILYFLKNVDCNVIFQCITGMMPM